jgi:hypothetical protein
VIKSVTEELSSNKTLKMGVLFLVAAFLLSLLSMYPDYRPLSLPAAILAVLGAFLAIKGYLSFLGKLKTQRSQPN